MTCDWKGFRVKGFRMKDFRMKGFRMKGFRMKDGRKPGFCLVAAAFFVERPAVAGLRHLSGRPQTVELPSCGLLFGARTSCAVGRKQMICLVAACNSEPGPLVLSAANS